MKEHRAQLRENNFLGLFTSVAEYTRRQTFSLATKPLDVYSRAPNESCFVDCYVEKMGYLLKKRVNDEQSFSGYVCHVHVVDFASSNKKISIEGGTNSPSNSNVRRFRSNQDYSDINNIPMELMIYFFDRRNQNIDKNTKSVNWC